jgi:histidinol-phosphate aminotransferase
MVIQNRQLLDGPIAAIITERERVMTELKGRKCVKTFPSQANFVLMKTPLVSRDLFNGLLSQGVLIRDVSSYPLLENTVRVSIGRPAENDRFLAALDNVMAKAQEN